MFRLVIYYFGEYWYYITVEKGLSGRAVIIFV
jgi:hypothetical protein